MNNQKIVEVRFYETDAMGIVHHSNYLRWLEIARFDFAEKFMPETFRKMAEKSMYLPVVNAQLSYREYLGYGDVICITTSLVKSDVAKLVFLSKVTKKDSKKIVAKGYTEHVFVNSEKRMYLRMPQCVCDDLERLKELHPEYILKDLSSYQY